MKDKSLFNLQMKKFGFLVYYGLKKRIWTKAFLIANIIILFLSLFLAFLPRFFTEKIEESYNISVVLNKDDQKVKDTINALNAENTKSEKSEYKYKILYTIDENENVLDNQLNKIKEDNSLRAVLIFNINNQIDYNDLKLDIIYSNLVKPNNLNNLKNIYSNIILKLNNQEKNPYNIVINTRSVTKEKEERKQTAKIIAIVILFTSTFVIMLLSNMLGTEIIKEKETKAVEIILSSITPKVHFMSKITSLLLFLLVQGLLILINLTITGLLLGNNVNQNNFDINQIPILSDNLLSSTILFAGAFGFIGLIIMLLLTGILASMSNSFEEYQSAITPISIITFIPAYLVFFLIEQTNFLSELTLKIFSYVPIFSTFIAPVTYFAGLITWYEALISLFISIILMCVLIYLFSPIYRKNILSYSKSKILAKITSFFNFKKGNK